MLGRQGLEEGEPGGRRQRAMGTRRQAVETGMKGAGREGVRKKKKKTPLKVQVTFWKGSEMGKP